METLTTILSEQTVRQIGWVLVHFLWQGLAAAAIMWAVLKVLGKSPASMRYIAACIGMLLMTSAPAITLIALHEPKASPPAQVVESNANRHFEAVPEKMIVLTDDIAAEPLQKPLHAVLAERLEAALPLCVIAWAAGVAALSLWYLGGWCQLQKLRLIGTKPASEQITARTAELAQRLGITRAVRIAESVLVQVPTMIGWLRPVILLPATALTGLDEVQLRAMIAHELAHIRRHDYLVNILQTAVEILGFYHPAVWWMSRQVRIERENCCDDMAAELLQDRQAYAKALFSMEEIRIRQTALAMGANGGSLVCRIGRLIGKTETTSSMSGWIASAATLLVVSGLLVSAAMAMSNKADGTKADIESDKLITYQVDRTVSEYPQADDFSTPESAYAAINRVMASGNREGWMRVSTKANAERIAQSQRRDQQVPPEWAKVVLNARILKVLIQGDRAMVIAQFPQELSSKKIVNPIDARSLKLEDGKWLNAGEDRFDSVEEAAEKFGALVEREDKTEAAYTNVLDQAQKFKQMAEQLFSNLRRADYEAILSYYDEPTGKWKQDGWKRLDLNYTVYTDWPSFAVWVCRTFKDNPIVSVELSDVILSEKEFDGYRAPAVPYKLTLQDGSILQGELYFAYRVSSHSWQPAEGIDWHLQKEPIKRAGSDKEQQALKLESMNRLKKLGLAHAMFRDDRGEGVSPGPIADLKPWLDNESHLWLIKNAELLWTDCYPKEQNPGISPLAYDRTFLQTYGQRIIVFMDGHVEADKNNRLKNILDTAVRLSHMSQLKHLTAEIVVWSAEKNNSIFPNSLEQLPDGIIKQWGLQNAVYLGKGRSLEDMEKPATEVLVYDKSLLDSHNGTNVVFMDSRVEFLSLEKLNTLLQKQGVEGSDVGGLGGGIMHSKSNASALDAETSAQNESMLSGTVVDSSGNPAAGVLVLPMPHGGDPLITDAQGRFDLPGPSQDPDIDRRIDFLLIRSPQTNEAAVAYLGSLVNPIRIQLQPALTLFGRVTDSAGRPIVGAKVVPSVHHDWKAGFGNTAFERTTINGTFEIRGLPVELEYSLYAAAPGHSSYEEHLGQFAHPGRIEIDTIVLNGSEQVAIEARFILANGGLLDGIVKDAVAPVGTVIEGAADSEAIKAAIEDKPLTEHDLPVLDSTSVDNEAVKRIIQATQKQETAKHLSAPRAVVLNNEAVTLTVTKSHRIKQTRDKPVDLTRAQE